MKKVIIINGPNLNLVGIREPGMYGNQSLKDFFELVEDVYKPSKLEFYQSNIEGEIINKLQEVGFSYDGIILNAGGYTHTSIAIADAIAAITTPVIEVHISNIFAREEIRHQSIIGKNCIGVIAGLGLESYNLAISHFMSQNSTKK